MSMDLHVRVTSKGMQKKIKEYIGENGLYENTSELVRAALRHFFTEEELKSQIDTREALYPHELSDKLKAELEKGNYGDRDPELDHLME